jgi:hypothetical protein
MANKIAAYKEQVDYQLALEKKVNEINLEKATQRAASLMQLKFHEISPTDRRELGLISEAEHKEYAQIEARMDEYLKEHEPWQYGATEARKQIFAEVMDDIKTDPHALKGPVPKKVMDDLIDLFGGATLKQAKQEVSMMQISKETPKELSTRLFDFMNGNIDAATFNAKNGAVSMMQKDEPQEEPQAEEDSEAELDPESTKMVEKMENAASFANNIERLRQSDWAKLINQGLGNPVGKGKFAWSAAQAFNNKMAINRRKGKVGKKEEPEAEPVAKAAEGEEEPDPALNVVVDDSMMNVIDMDMHPVGKAVEEEPETEFAKQ